MTHRRIVHDAQEFAGEFYEKNRSKKFRATFPDQMEYVKAEWPRFVEAVRACYAQMLASNDPAVTEKMKEEIYEALTADASASFKSDAEAPLQVHPNTQAFEGDRKENSLTDETYGIAPGKLKGRLLRTATRRLH